MTLGKRRDLLKAPSEELAGFLTLDSPVLNSAELSTVKKERKTATVSTLYPIAFGPSGLEVALKGLCEEAERQVRDGAEVVVLSDFSEGGLTQENSFIPPLLAVGAVHHHLT